MTTNFTLFGEGNNAGDIPRISNVNIPLFPQACPDGSHANGRQSGSASAPNLGTGIMVSRHSTSTNNIDTCYM